MKTEKKNVKMVEDWEVKGETEIDSLSKTEIDDLNKAIEAEAKKSK